MSSAGDDLDWKQVEWPANCGKCRQPFDCLVDNHLSLCGGCQKQFADCDSCDMRYDHSNGGNPTRCAACIQRQFGACTSCMVQFDRMADRHQTRCGVCQILFGTKNEGPADPNRANYVHCRLCTRFFPPNKKNNGIHCTACCNKEAAKGKDLIAPVNLPPAPKAAEALRNARAGQQQPAQASGSSVASASRATMTFLPPGFQGYGIM